MIDVKNRIEKQTDENGNYYWDMKSVMQKVRPNCMFELTMKEGSVKMTKWDEFNNWDEEKQGFISKPTEFEIVREMIIQETIAECFQYFQNK